MCISVRASEDEIVGIRTCHLRGAPLPPWNLNLGLELALGLQVRLQLTLVVIVSTTPLL